MYIHVTVRSTVRREGTRGTTHTYLYVVQNPSGPTRTSKQTIEDAQEASCSGVSVSVVLYMHSCVYYTSSFARFSYSECGLCVLRSLTHMGVMSSLTSATPSVAYARFARSLTWA